MKLVVGIYPIFTFLGACKLKREILGHASSIVLLALHLM